MTISSTSTDQEVWDEYDDCASYEETGSRDLALRFLTACRVILRRRPATAGRKEMSMSFETVSGEMESARQWLNAHPPTTATGANKTRFVDLSNFRD